MFKTAPSIISCSKENLNEKISFYLNDFGFNGEEFTKIIKRMPNIFNFSTDTMKEKVNYYLSKFDLTVPELRKMSLLLPCMLAYSTDSVNEKVAFYQSEFDLTRDEFSAMVKRMPALLNYTKENIDEKANYFKHTFGIENQEFISMLKRLPSLLSLSRESMNDKIVYFTKEYGLTKDQFSRMVKDLPNLLAYSKESLDEKKKQIQDVGLPKEFLANFANVFSVPANNLKVRMLILRQVAPRDEIMRWGWHITCQDKTFARMMYFANETNANPKLSNLLLCEKLFQKKYGISSEDLMKMYPLTKENIERMKQNLKHENFEFSPEEKTFLETQYGE